eukprot:CAMPEP_0206217036 /NCGR_PEP_ID=MMETSP0047_2-20121206/3058_1 /ASSEMBLY_ACC=CAM_ASM_000192 /TAXON_ID=195065 /ORGANISM="Chroomonas mesostigmatica_cf, Strain CCMP1168" /LENGTH=99 /DNA_ID=CAMNT_0053639459 /DNA_START=204 /DNA_END=500 /DNA_ORIENTATION=+
MGGTVARTCRVHVAVLERSRAPLCWVGGHDYGARHVAAVRVDDGEDLPPDPPDHARNGVPLRTAEEAHLPAVRIELHRYSVLLAESRRVLPLHKLVSIT